MSSDRDPEFESEWRAFDMLVDHARDLVGAAASVEVASLYEGRVGVCEIVPRNPRARPISLTAEQWLIVEVGGPGGRLELDYAPEHVERAKRIIEAAVAGRVTERSAFGRSRVTLTMEDGERVSETGYSGCATLLVPLPGWTRWSELKTFEPYEAQLQ